MDELTELVTRTRGPQPWRKLFHAVNGVVIAAALSYDGTSDRVATLTLSAISAVLLAVDLARFVDRRANALFFRWLNRLASPRELGGVASSTWYAIGILAVVALFERSTAVSAVLVLALADPLAGYLGRRWGKRAFLGGTVLGSAAFFLAGFVIVGVRHGWWVAAPVALVVTIVERKCWPLDDNLAIPLACAGAIAAIGWVS
jgi:dolichol kinase